MAGDGQASRRSLASADRLERVTYQIVTYDRYGRSVAMVWAGSSNLSCWQLRRGYATYVAKWDDGKRLASVCRFARIDEWVFRKRHHYVVIDQSLLDLCAAVPQFRFHFPDASIFHAIDLPWSKRDADGR